jgi:hypothetical protein
MKPTYRPHRKFTPKVRDGKVLRKKSWKETPNYWNTRQNIPVIDQEPPGYGYKHFLKKRDILSFIDILPDWETISAGLNAIILSEGMAATEGLHYPHYGIIEICAWEKEMWIKIVREDYEEHKDLLERLNVTCEKRHHYFLCKFDEKSIKAYQLLHIFLHELGHHYDQMTTRSQRESSRGESFAEEYAFKYENLIFNKYFEIFGY